MDEPARKRRRTNSPQEPERQSSPLRQPPRRPSFASPTKASLSRNYPNLLPPTSAKGEISTPGNRGGKQTLGKQARALIPGEGEGEGQGDLDQAITEDGGKSVAVAQQPPAKATARGGKAAASKVATTSTNQLEEDEGELPMTPSQRGLEEQDVPRRGILFSSPSKRPPRVKDPTKKSPLKRKIPTSQAEPVTPSVEETTEHIPDLDESEKKQGPDPEVEARKQEKARLQRELELLEAQISRGIEEITKEQQRTSEQSLRSAERNDLADFIIKSSGASTKDEQPISVSNLLCSFLPFPAFIAPQSRLSQPDKPVPSHRPIELEDPLPFLKMFTSLQFSTRVDLPRGQDPTTSSPVRQKHTVNIVGPQKLLSTQLSVVVDASANEVAEMQILRLSSWAERELGAFVRSKAEENDLGNACWAIESFWTIANKRAEYWNKCQAAFAHLIAGHADEDTENVRSQTKATQVISRKDLNRHLGRDTLVLQDKHVLLKLNWRISFDWTGEAASEITAEAAVPQVWQEADTRASFKKVSETFASLITDKGVYEGTKIMAALLFTK